jgi:REP element-mobilizing transposase RayT
MNRVVDRQYVFDDQEKQKFRNTLRRLERFSGVEILTYSLMSNHFHLLVHVPDPVHISDQELEKRLHAIYPPRQVRNFMAPIETCRAQGQDEWAEDYRRPFLARMYDLPCFMKELQQRFTQNYNIRHQRKGTLWEERYTSVLVEDAWRSLLVIAAYIDLNPVRAGLCREPAEYHFSGYGEAMGGGHRACTGLRRLLGHAAPNARLHQVLPIYRRYLVSEPGEAVRGRPRAQRPLELSPSEVLRFRIRYFSKGLALGSREFVEGIFRHYRHRFGPGREEAACSMEGADWQELCVLQRMRLPGIG